MRQPSEKLVCVDVVLLEEEGQSADDRFERIVIFVRSLADFVKEVHIIQKTKFVLVQEPDESFQVFSRDRCNVLD